MYASYLFTFIGYYYYSDRKYLFLLLKSMYYFPIRSIGHFIMHENDTATLLERGGIRIRSFLKRERRKGMAGSWSTEVSTSLVDN